MSSQIRARGMDRVFRFQYEVDPFEINEDGIEYSIDNMISGSTTLGIA